MGKAQIMSGGDDGLYQLKLLFDTTRSQDKIDRFTNTIDNTSPGTFPHEAAIVNRARVVANAPDDETVSAWCADYTEDLSGDVGTIEIPGERQRPVIIRPGYNGRATYDFRRDGQLTPVAAMTGAAAFLAAALLPGWQKWRPQYRVGIIIDRRIAGTGFLFDVALDDEHSTARNLSVNASNNLVDVPAEYMQTGSVSFEVGDRVVIEFINRDYKRPRIIGFETNPRRPEAVFYIKVTRDDGSLITDAYTVGFAVIASDSSQAVSVDEEYDDDASSPTYQYWKITAHWYPYKEIDTDGYWIIIGCEDSVPTSTQYPYRYKEADKNDTDDLIAPGIYSAAIPYWIETLDSTLDDENFDFEQTQHSITNVKSSIPFRVIWNITPHVGSVEMPQFDNVNWYESHEYGVNHVCRPTTGNYTGYGYQCIISGTSGVAEPAWPTTPGDTVVDGTVTWECIEVRWIIVYHSQGESTGCPVINDGPIGDGAEPALLANAEIVTSGTLGTITPDDGRLLSIDADDATDYHNASIAGQDISLEFTNLSPETRFFTEDSSGSGDTYEYWNTRYKSCVTYEIEYDY